MTFSYEIRGISRLKNALRKLAALDRNILEPETEKWAGQTVKTLRATPYPAKRPGQTYVRKGRLTGSWKDERQGIGKWAIVNLARGKGQGYAAYVVGENQSWFHLGRWWKARDIIEKRIPALTNSLAKKIEDIWTSG